MDRIEPDGEGSLRNGMTSRSGPLTLALSALKFSQEGEEQTFEDAWEQSSSAQN